MKYTLTTLFIVLLTPTVSFAVEKPTDFKSLVFLLIDIVQGIIPLLILLAVLAFFWGVIRFVGNTGGGNEKDEAKNIMFWGVIALFVMVSVWGIVGLLKQTFISGGSATTEVIFPGSDFR